MLILSLIGKKSKPLHIMEMIHVHQESIRFRETAAMYQASQHRELLDIELT